jgi:drug/metabolite transporter (DMT)-like permease
MLSSPELVKNMHTDTAIITTILAEIALALHPIIIKEIPVSLSTQLLARLGTYGTLSFALATPEERGETWGSISSAGSSLALGIMTIVHILSSYISYALLPAGSALALFYTHPFMNILAGALLLGESIPLWIIPLMLVAFLGVILIAKSTREEDVAKPAEHIETPFKGITWGVIMALISAFTETLIFLVAKVPRGAHTPWFSMSRLYPGALLAFITWILSTGRLNELYASVSASSWAKLLSFNILVGFLGYSLRFFSIPLLPTAIFSILTFIGVVAGYIWGIVFSNEIPKIMSLIGAGCITGALTLVQAFKV